jgi:TonB family protein
MKTAVFFFLFLALTAQGQLPRIRQYLSAEDAEKLEQRLQADPEDLEARAPLLAYYLLKVTQEPESARFREARRRHILWLIEHHPESEMAVLSEASLSEAGPAADPEGRQQATELWRKQADQHASDPRILGNAAGYFQWIDRRAAIELLKRAQQADPNNKQWSRRLGGLYALEIANAERVNPPGVFSSARPDPALAKQAQEELEHSSDATLVGAAGQSLRGMGNRLGEELLRKARTLEPDNPAWSEAERGQAEPANGLPVVPGRIRVGPNIQERKLIQRVPPVYPPLARQARISGVVRFDAIIGRDGRVSNLQLISGHPLLVQPAQDAVQQWVYEPTLLNGQPVEIVTTIDVRFSMDEAELNPASILAYI